MTQGTVLLVKGGEKTIYLELVVIGQFMHVANADLSINLEALVFKDNEVILYVPVYNKETRFYDGLKKKLGQITHRGDDQERFFSYGYSKEKKYPVVLLCEATFAEHF